MPDQSTEVTVCISIDVGSDPIRGRIADLGGNSCSFAGWMELAGLIEQVREAGEPQTPMDPRRTA